MQLCKEIKDKLPKPSDFVDNMVAGLRRDDLNIAIDMSTFGCEVPMDDGNVCFGCAATCSLYNLFNRVANGTNIGSRKNRAEFFNIEVHDLKFFENVVDSLRHGVNHRAVLGKAYGIDWVELPDSNDYLPYLRNGYTDNDVEEYAKYAQLLREAGY